MTRCATCRTAAIVLLVMCSLTPRLVASQTPADVPRPIDPSELARAPSTWKGALSDSLRLLLIEHSTRIAFQEKTRRELGGPFLRDYLRSIKLPETWEDGDSWLVNYLGHPIHGAASGFIWLDHEDGSHDPKLGFSKEYWASRGRATAWAAGYSLRSNSDP